ncbi:probable ubiquitin-conjugating enzyme E2 25 isoform X1 [Cucumis sativus]|uniref:probable ubiquitin-conjugating enzyme E2 25 isoform X1 n=1 Tax=Cucumis sativus TaxID=3659 RepID=UPI0005EC3864|nr:probable ubiquitin-conjugating enzyme E2 25 isoform X1 [Cucumis sativus]
MIRRSSKMLKNKGVISLDVIDVDKDEASDAMFIHQKFDANDKGKGIYHHGDHQLKKTLGSHSFNPDVEILESTNEVESNFPSASHNLIDLDNPCSYSSNEDDDWLGIDEFMDVDAYSALQAHFDHMDIPPDIEAPIPWMTQDQNGNKTNIETSRTSWSTLAKPQSVPGSVNHLGKSTTQVQVKEVSNGLHLPADINVLNHLHSFGSFPPQDIQPNKKPAASRRDKHEVSHLNSLLGIYAAKSRWFLDPFKHKKKLHGSNNISINSSDAMKLHNGGETSDASYSVKKQVTSHGMPHPNFPESVDFIEYLGAGHSMPQWPEYAKTKTKEPFFPPHMASGFYGSFNPFVPPTLGEVVDVPWVQGSTQNLPNIAPNDSISEAIPPADKDKFLGNFENFKQFDTIDDHSDHHYASKGSSLNQASKKWTKKIQDDWKILQNDLPETIFVRVYESRMDLMRAVIIGAQGTPYHDGLFFFDIFFPPRYPDLPPQVYYHSKGLRLNPNLYNCGKVCLSLLNTWRGNGNENWVPGMSTMLQVLVSIQGLILNTKPYFNEPGYAYQSGSEAGENRSHMYNEETYILSIKTMLFNIRRPPKHFEDFVRGHFYQRAHDILVACKAYINGAQVGSLVEGGVQDLELSDKSCSDSFKQSVTHLLSQLVAAFKGIGVSDCDKYLQMLSPTVPNTRKRPSRPVKLK